MGSNDVGVVYEGHHLSFFSNLVLVWDGWGGIEEGGDGVGDGVAVGVGWGEVRWVLEGGEEERKGREESGAGKEWSVWRFGGFGEI